jgi:hypothetical protein
MERMKHWRAEPTRSARVHRTNRRRSMGAAVAAGAMVAVAMPVLSSVSSDAAVGGRRSIEATTVSDLVVLEGYPRSARVYIKVVRGGTIVGSATKRAFRGAIELNHGGGPDCWESRRTPNIRPGDKIVTRIIGTRIRDFMVVRGLFIDSATPSADGTSVDVEGRVNLTGRTGVPSGPLELRVRTANNDLRENIRADVQADGTWSHSIALPAGETADEVVLEWIGGGAGELTVAEPGDPALRATALQLPGCPRVEPN